MGTVRKRSRKAFTRRGAGNRNPNDADRKAAVARAQRRAQALKLYDEGKTYAEIGDTLGTSTSQAARDVEKALVDLPAATAEQMRKRDNATLDADDRRLGDLIRVRMTRARRPGETSDEAARTVARLIEKRVAIQSRRAKLNGLDAPEKHELTGAGGGPIGVTEISEDMLLSKLAAALDGKKPEKNTEDE